MRVQQTIGTVALYGLIATGLSLVVFAAIPEGPLAAQAQQNKCCKPAVAVPLLNPRLNEQVVKNTFPGQRESCRQVKPDRIES